MLPGGVAAVASVPWRAPPNVVEVQRPTQATVQRSAALLPGMLRAPSTGWFALLDHSKDGFAGRIYVTQRNSLLRWVTIATTTEAFALPEFGRTRRKESRQMRYARIRAALGGLLTSAVIAGALIGSGAAPAQATTANVLTMSGSSVYGSAYNGTQPQSLSWCARATGAGASATRPTTPS